MSNKEAKIRKLLEVTGHKTIERYVRAALGDSLAPAICMNDECSYVLDLERDQEEGYCDACHTNSMVAGLILLGFI